MHHDTLKSNASTFLLRYECWNKNTVRLNLYCFNEASCKNNGLLTLPSIDSITITIIKTSFGLYEHSPNIIEFKLKQVIS